jgi:hypothetical protein
MKQKTIQRQEYKQTKKINQKLINEIIEVKDKYGLTAENLLRKAQDSSSELHKHFEWDNSTAAHRFRLIQAAYIINSVSVKVEGKDTPAFEYVTINRAREFKDNVEIMSNETLRKQILDRAITYANSWKETYERYNYGELKPIISSINRVKKEVDEKWSSQKKN